MKKVFTLLLALIALTASAQTSMHIYMGSSHYIYETEQIDSIIFIDNLANPLGDGTLESPYNVAAALKAGSELNEGQTIDSVYVKGYVVKLQSAPLTQYGNASYQLSDSRKVTNRLYIYRGYSLGGLPFATDDELKLGDEAVVCGQLSKYSDGTVELIDSYLYSINGQTYVDLREGDGTLESPFNAIAAAAYARSFGADTPSDQAVYIKGKVASIGDPFSTTYGNSTFYISDDGTMSNTFYAYRVLYLGNQKFKEGNTQIKEGDEVILYGKVINYRGTYPETAQGECYLYSLNGVTEENVPDPDPNPNPDAKGTLESPFTPAEAITYTTALGSDVESTDSVYVKGKISSIKYTYSAQYGTATYFISADGTDTDAFEVYGSYYFNNQPWKDGDIQIAIGDEVIVSGIVVNYKGTTPEFANKKNHLYSINGRTTN